MNEVNNQQLENQEPTIEETPKQNVHSAKKSSSKLPIIIGAVVAAIAVVAVILVVLLGGKGGGAHEHSWSNWKATKTPTCSESGEKTRTCACGEQETEAIEPTGNHKYTSKVTTEATCTTAGVKTFTCSKCNDTYTESINATNIHNYIEEVITAPTCTNTGVKSYSCTVCLDAYTQTIPVSNTHNYVSGKCTDCSIYDISSFNLATIYNIYDESTDTYNLYACFRDSNNTPIAVNFSATIYIGDVHNEIIYQEDIEIVESDYTTYATQFSGDLFMAKISINRSNIPNSDAPNGSMLVEVTYAGKTEGVNANIANLPTTPFEPLVYSGTGDDVITGINVPYGLYRVVITNSGTNYFSAKSYDANGNYMDLLASTSGSNYVGEALFREGSIEATENWRIDISSRSTWTVRIEKITDEVTSNLQGTGKVVTGLFSGSGTCVVSITNSGSEYFCAKLYDEFGEYIDLLVSSSGSAYSGKKSIKLDANKRYFVIIESKSNWTVDFGLTDEVSICNPNRNGDQNGGSSDSNNSSDDTLWTYTEAYTLFDYADKATDGMSEASSYLTKYLTASSASTKDLYLSYVVNYLEYVRGYLGKMQELANANAGIELSNSEFATLQEKITYTYELFDVIVGLDVNEYNHSSCYSTILTMFWEAYAECNSIMSLSASFLGVFGN